MMDFTYDETNKNCIRFKKGKLNLTINDVDICFPSYINRAVSRYRFNTEALILERLCSHCNGWFLACKYENNTFKPINNEKELHYLGPSSGFYSYCQKCSKEKKEENSNTDNKPTTSDEDSNISYRSGEKSHLNIIIDLELKEYLKYKSISKRTNLTSLIIEILTDYKNKNPLNLSINQEIS